MITINEINSVDNIRKNSKIQDFHNLEPLLDAHLITHEGQNDILNNIFTSNVQLSSINLFPDDRKQSYIDIGTEDCILIFIQLLH